MSQNIPFSSNIGGKLRSIVRFMARMVLRLGILAALVILLPRLLVTVYSWTRLYPVESAPSRPVAIVFGAGLRRDGAPTPVLRERVNAAAELYFAGKVDKLLMSGDNRFVDYNEPAAMGEYAESLGVPHEDIVLDFAGRRTYDTCYRARHIFEVEDAILVTQSFHQPRALYLCNSLGVRSVGVPATGNRYRKLLIVWWNIRETGATLAAVWEVNVTRPLPVLGEPEPIFMGNKATGD